MPTTFHRNAAPNMISAKPDAPLATSRRSMPNPAASGVAHSVPSMAIMIATTVKRAVCRPAAAKIEMSGDSNPRCAQFPIIASRCGAARNINAVSRTADPRSDAPRVSAAWVLRKVIIRNAITIAGHILARRVRQRLLGRGPATAAAIVRLCRHTAHTNRR